MPSVLAYHRPQELDEAADLLGRPDTAALAGGTLIVPTARQARDRGIELVDLQDLALDGVTETNGRLLIGAMARLGDLADQPETPPLLRELCRRELPSALRNQATVGGTVAAAEAESLLLAGLLVHDARVHLHRGGVIDLEDYLDERPADIITVIDVDPSGHGAVTSTGRTPADTPIVAAIGLQSPDRTLVALTGVAPTPVLVDPTSPTTGLDPTADFRGSSPYRLHLAEVLTARVVEEVSR